MRARFAVILLVAALIGWPQATPSQTLDATRWPFALEPELKTLFVAAGVSTASFIDQDMLVVGDRLLAADRPDDARVIYQRLLTAADPAAREMARARLGRLAAQEGRLLEAVDIYRAALRGFAGEDGKEPVDFWPSFSRPGRIEVLNDLAMALNGLKRPAEALSAVDIAMAEKGWNRTADEGLYGQVLATRAAALEGVGRWADAESVRAVALGLARKSLPGDPAAVSAGELALAANLARQGKAAQAEALYRSVLTAYERTYAADHPSTIETRAALASLRLTALARPREALQDLRIAAKILTVRGPLQPAADQRRRARLDRFRDVFRDEVHAAWRVAEPAPANPTAVAVATPQKRKRGAALRHVGVINGLAFSPDGSKLVSGSEDHSAIVWDLENQAAIRRLRTRDMTDVRAVAFSAADGLVATASLDGQARLWSVDRETPVYQAEGPTWSLTLSDDGRWMAGWGMDELWIEDRQAATRRRLQYPEVITDVPSMALSPDGKTLALGGGDIMKAEVCLFAFPQGDLLRCGRPKSIGSLTDLKWTPDASRLIAGEGSMVISIDPATFTVERFYRGVGGWAVAVSPDGAKLATGDRQGAVRIVDISTGAQLQQLDGHAGLVRVLAFSPDGLRLASGSDDRTIRLWDVLTGSGLAVLGGAVNSSEHSGEITRARYLADGQVLSASLDETVRLWDAAAGVQKALYGGMGVNDADVSPDGRRLLVRGVQVKIYDLKSGKPLIELPMEDSGYTAGFLGHGGFYTNPTNDGFVLYAADGRRLWAISTPSVDEIFAAPAGDLVATVRRRDKSLVWNSRTGAQLYALPAGTWSVAFSPDGRSLLANADRMLLLDASTGAVKRDFPLPEPREALFGAAMSAKGGQAVAWSQDHVLIWADAAQPAKTVKRDGFKVSAVTMSGDGATVAIGYDDGAAVLVDVATGAERAKLTGHESAVSHLSFSKDGSRLLSGSLDLTLRTWNVADGAPVVVLGQ